MNKILDVKKSRETLNKKMRVYHLFCQIIILLIVLPLLPVYGIIACLIILECLLTEHKFKSPIFNEMRFSQGKYFPTYKFLVYVSDGRLTKFGFILRKFYLDELPQLFNIINGEMVIVGPRPNPIKEYFQIKTSGFYAKVIQRAGLTGGIQAAKGSNRHGDLTLDEDYMHFCLTKSLSEIIIFDIKTMLNTLKLMQKAEGL